MTDHQRVMLVGLVVLVTLVQTGVTSPGVEVEDLTGKQFEAALETEDNLAVYWCKYLIELHWHHPIKWFPYLISRHQHFWKHILLFS